MSRNIQQSLSDLGHDIASFRQSTSQFNRAAGSISMLFRSNAFKSAAKTVEIQQKFDAAVKLRDRAKDIIEAKNAMAAQPNRWKSTSDYLKERDELKAARERVSERKKDKASAFTEWHNRQYGNTPNVLGDRVRQFGGQGGRVAFEQDFMDAYNSEFDPKTYQYEQDVKTWGKNKADTLKQSREEKERKHNRYSYMRLQAERQRDQKSRIYENAPWMKSLIQSGKIDKKHLPSIDKNLMALAKAPGGGAVMSMMKSPLTAIPLIAAKILGFGIATYGKMMNAHSEDQRLEDAELFGREGHGFRDSAYAHGLDEMGSINSFQNVQAKYGPATYAILEAFAQHAGRSDVPAWAKQQFAMSLGLDRDQANIAMMMYGKKKPTIGHEWMWASMDAKKEVRDKRKSFGGMLSSEAWEALIGSDEQVNALTTMKTGRSRGRLEAIHRNYRMEEAGSRVRKAVETVGMQTAAASSYGSRGGNSYSSSGSYTVNAPININIKGDADPKMVASSVREGMTQALDAAARQRNLSAMTTEWVA